MKQYCDGGEAILEAFRSLGLGRGGSPVLPRPAERIEVRSARTVTPAPALDRMLIERESS